MAYIFPTSKYVSNVNGFLYFRSNICFVLQRCIFFWETGRCSAHAALANFLVGIRAPQTIGNSIVTRRNVLLAFLFFSCLHLVSSDFFCFWFSFSFFSPSSFPVLFLSLNFPTCAHPCVHIVGNFIPIFTKCYVTLVISRWWGRQLNLTQGQDKHARAKGWMMPAHSCIWKRKGLIVCLQKLLFIFHFSPFGSTPKKYIWLLSGTCARQVCAHKRNSRQRIWTLAHFIHPPLSRRNFEILAWHSSSNDRIFYVSHALPIRTPVIVLWKGVLQQTVRTHFRFFSCMRSCGMTLHKQVVHRRIWFQHAVAMGSRVWWSNVCIFQCVFFLDGRCQKHHDHMSSSKWESHPRGKGTNGQNNGLRCRNAITFHGLLNLQYRVKFWTHGSQAGADWIDWWVNHWIPMGSRVIVSYLPGAIGGCRQTPQIATI